MVGVARAGSPRQFSLFPRAASIPAAEEFLRPLHSFVSTAFRSVSQNDVAPYFGVLPVWTNGLSKDGGVVGRLVDTAYLPETVSGVASDEEGLDSPQTSGNVFLLVNFFSLLVMEVVVQKNIPQKQYGGRRFSLAVGITPPG